MPDEPSLGEIGRAVARIEMQLGRLVGVDVYTAHRLADQERMARLEADQRAERAAREKLEAEWRKATTDQEDRRSGDRRWVVAALIVPAASLLLQLYLASRGAS